MVNKFKKTASLLLTSVLAVSTSVTAFASTDSYIKTEKKSINKICDFISNNWDAYTGNSNDNIRAQTSDRR